MGAFGATSQRPTRCPFIQSPSARAHEDRGNGHHSVVRVRVGIGRPPGRQDPADFVLKDFSSAEAKDLPWLLDHAADAVEAVVLEGLENAQQRYHTKA